MKSLETQIAELTESQKADKTEIARLQGVVAAADKTVASARLVELCKEAALPEVAVEKLKLAFKDAVTTNGMSEAVNVEKAYVASIKEATGKITRNNGAQQTEAKESELKESQKKSFMAAGFSEAMAKSMAGIE
jgi:hypothetical protein